MRLLAMQLESLLFPPFHRKNEIRACLWQIDANAGKYKGNMNKKVPNFRFGTFLIVRCEDGFKNNYVTNYASMFAYVAFFSMNSRRGATSSPISMEKI